MLTIVCFETEKPKFTQRIKRRLFSAEPVFKKVQCNEIGFELLFLPENPQKLNGDWVKELFARNKVYVPSVIREQYKLPKGIQLHLEQFRYESALEIEAHIELQLQEHLQNNKIVVVDQEGILHKKVEALLQTYDNIEILTQNTEYYGEVADSVFRELGAVIGVKELFTPIENSYVLDFFDKGRVFKGRNTIFGGQSRATNSLLLTDFCPKLKQSYLRQKPKELTEEEFFYLLRDYCGLKDLLSLGQATCLVNGVKRNINQAIEAIQKNIT